MILLIMRRLDSFQEKNDTNLFIGPGNSLKQTFTAGKDGLAGIRLLVFNPRLGGRAKYKLTLTDEGNNLIWQDLISESNLGWAEEFRYDFKGIANSKNKTFIFSIEYFTDKEINPSDKEILSLINRDHLNLETIPQGMEETLDRVQKSFLSLGYSRTDNYRQGAAYLEGSMLEGDLVFKIFHQTTTGSYLKSAGSDFSFRIRQDPAFFIFFFTLIFILTLVFWHRIKLLLNPE